jgi:hypothetical protein
MKLKGQIAFSTADPDDLCSLGLCVQTERKCSNSCSGHGTCVAYDYNGKITDSCKLIQSDCSVACQCDPDWWGADCSLNKISFDFATAMREDMCKGLFRIQSMEDDDSSDAIASRASSIAELLRNADEVNEDALVICSDILTQTILNYPALAASDTSLFPVITALSSVLEKRDLPSGIIERVTFALTNITLGRQTSLATGEDGTGLYTGKAHKVLLQREYLYIHIIYMIYMIIQRICVSTHQSEVFVTQ